MDVAAYAKSGLGRWDGSPNGVKYRAALTKVTAVWSDLRSVIFIHGGGDVDNQWLLKRMEKANISDRQMRARKTLVWSDLQKRFSKPFSQSWMKNHD